MKRYRLSLALLSLLILTSIVGIFSINGLNQSTDLDYTFDDNQIYNYSNNNYTDSYNLRNQTSFTEVYNATYSFTNDVIGSEPNDWISNNGINCYTIINESLDGHNNILNMSDSSATFLPDITNSFSSDIIIGNIEWWQYASDASKRMQVLMNNGVGTTGIALRLVATNYQSIDGAGDPVASTISNNVWYHHRIDFNSNTDTFDWYINGILELDDTPFLNVVDEISEIELLGYGVDTSYYTYFDAIGYSWDGYNATYSMTNEPDGETGTAIDFADFVTTTANTELFNYKEGHYKVIAQTNIGSSDYLYANFDSITSGIVEYWALATENDESCPMYFREDGTILIECTFSGDGTIFAIDNVSYETLDVSYDVDRWYHFKFEWYSNNTFDVYIDNILVGNNFGFKAGATQTDGINRFYFRAYDTTGYLDSIGYSWDSFYEIGDNLIHYSIGDNIVPYYTTSQTIKEPDLTMFDYKILYDQYAVGDDEFWDWDEIDDVNDLVNTALNPWGFDDRVILINNTILDPDDFGIEKEFDIEDGVLNVSWRCEPEVLGVSAVVVTKIYSHDDTLILEIHTDNQIHYIDGGTNTLWLSLMNPNHYYDVNVYINNDDGIAVLSYAEDGIFQYSYTFPMLDSSKDGLGKIEYYLDVAAVRTEIYLGSIGVYINGSSISTDRSMLFLQEIIGTATWTFEEAYLIFIDAIAPNFTLDIVSHASPPPASVWGTPHYQDSLEGLTTYNVYELTINLLGFMDNPDIQIVFYDNMTLTSISLEGAKLVESSNEYFIEFTYANVDIEENYFYVDSSNRLRGICYYNNSDLEFIQANFDINLLNENRSLRFKSQFTGQYGFFSLSYIDATSSTVDLPISTTSHNILLPQAKTIDEFVFLISDDDNLEAGFGSGYITDIELIWNPSISITIVTISLIMVVVPLIIILVPTLTIYSKYGKSVLMPVFILMCIICFAGGLIPAWLFFILIVPSFIFMVLRKGSDE